MIDIRAFFKRKRSDSVAEGAPPEKPRQHEPGKAAPFIGGARERIQDLLVGHDGERVGFRWPVQG